MADTAALTGGARDALMVQHRGRDAHEGITMPASWVAGWDWDGEGWRHGPFFRARLDDVRWTCGHGGGASLLPGHDDATAEG